MARKTPKNTVLTDALANARANQRAIDEATTPKGVDTGPNIFDAIETFSSVGQITALRGICNGALIGAIFAATDYLESDLDNDAARTAMAQNTQLYNYARQELRKIASGPFDEPMDLEAALDFAQNNATAQSASEVPAELLTKLKVTAAQLKLVDEQNAKRAAERAKERRELVRANRDGIRAEVQSFLSSIEAYDVINLLTPARQAKMFQATQQKLSKAQLRVLGNRDRYSGAFGDAFLLANDIEKLDAAYVAFKRRNTGDEQLERAA